MKEKKLKYKIEFIEWVDSFGCSSGWAPVEAIDTCLVCQTVGFVVSENKEVISIANSIAYETEHTTEQSNGVMTIPKVSIKNRREL